MTDTFEKVADPAIETTPPVDVDREIEAGKKLGLALVAVLGEVQRQNDIITAYVAVNPSYAAAAGPYRLGLDLIRDIAAQELRA